MKSKPVSQQLSDAINNSPESLREIEKQTGINHSMLSRFVRGDRGISSDTFDALCKYLDLELRLKSK